MPPSGPIRNGEESHRPRLALQRHRRHLFSLGPGRQGDEGQRFGGGEKIPVELATRLLDPRGGVDGVPEQHDLELAVAHLADHDRTGMQGGAEEWHHPITAPVVVAAGGDPGAQAQDHLHRT